EAVARREDGAVWLVGEVAMTNTLVIREVRQVGDDQIELARDRHDQIAPQDVHAIAEAEAMRVGAREQHGGRADVRGPDLRMGGGKRERDGYRPRARADVGHSG